MMSGLETPDTVVDLRKRAGMDTPDVAPKELYHVIQEKKVDLGGSAQLFGSDRAYVLPGAAKSTAGPPVKPGVSELVSACERVST